MVYIDDKDSQDAFAAWYNEEIDKGKNPISSDECQKIAWEAWKEAIDFTLIECSEG